MLFSTGIHSNPIFLVTENLYLLMINYLREKMKEMPNRDWQIYTNKFIQNGKSKEIDKYIIERFLQIDKLVVLDQWISNRKLFIPRGAIPNLKWEILIMGGILVLSIMGMLIKRGKDLKNSFAFYCSSKGLGSDDFKLKYLDYWLVEFFFSYSHQVVINGISTVSDLTFINKNKSQKSQRSIFIFIMKRSPFLKS